MTLHLAVVGEWADTLEIRVDMVLVAIARTGVVDGEIQLEAPDAKNATTSLVLDIGGKAPRRRRRA